MTEFDHIDPALPILYIGDERLPPAKQPRQVRLSQPLLPPDLAQEAAQVVLFAAVQGLVHAPSIGTLDKYRKSRYGVSWRTIRSNRRGFVWREGRQMPAGRRTKYNPWLPLVLLLALAACTEAPATANVAPQVAPQSVVESVSGRAAPVGAGCPSGYPIKGNLTTRNGEAIYHVPGGAYYARTDPEECFATEADARAAGYRRAQR